MNTLENAIEKIITKINHHFEKGGFFRENGATARYYKIASCDYPNWDIDELMYLDITSLYSITFTDFTILRLLICDFIV